MPGISKRAIGDVDPEMRRDRALEAEHHADDADVADRRVAGNVRRRQIRHQAADQRRRHRRDHGVGRIELAAGGDAGDAPRRHLDLFGRRLEHHAAALCRDGVDQRMDQRFRAALDIAELLLHHRAARGAEPLDARPDPGRRDIVGKFVEFQLEQRRPQTLIDAAPAPGGDPVLGRDVFEAAASRCAWSTRNIMAP